MAAAAAALKHCCLWKSPTSPVSQYEIYTESLEKIDNRKLLKNKGNVAIGQNQKMYRSGEPCESLIENIHKFLKFGAELKIDENLQDECDHCSIDSTVLINLQKVSEALQKSYKFSCSIQNSENLTLLLTDLYNLMPKKSERSTKVSFDSLKINLLSDLKNKYMKSKENLFNQIPESDNEISEIALMISDLPKNLCDLSEVSQAISNLPNSENKDLLLDCLEATNIVCGIDSLKDSFYHVQHAEYKCLLEFDPKTVRNQDVMHFIITKIKPCVWCISIMLLFAHKHNVTLHVHTLKKDIKIDTDEFDYKLIRESDNISNTNVPSVILYLP